LSSLDLPKNEERHSLSESESRFRIKKGDIEIEYVGKPSDVNSRYEKAFEWVKGVPPISPPHQMPIGGKIKEEGEKPDRRGGARSKIVSRAIDEVISEGRLDTAKKAPEVLEELKRRAIPGVSLNNVNEALKRRAQSGVLERIKGTDRQWTYVRRTT